MYARDRDEVTVLAIGRRRESAVYDTAQKRKPKADGKRRR